MPIYEYGCATCGAQFEQLVRADDVPACPFCESRELVRKLSATAVGASSKSAGSSLPMAGGGCCGGSCGCH